MFVCHRGVAWLLCALHISWADAAAAPVEGSWWVSSCGRMCSPRGVVGYGTEHACGYRAVMMSGQYFYVHRAVANSFLGPPPSEEAWQVHHKDGNSSNNSLRNLKYVTCSQNHRHSYASGTRRSCGPKLSKPIEYTAPGSKTWTKCPSMAAAALQIAVSASAIGAVCKQRGGGRVKGYQDLLTPGCCLEKSGGGCCVQCHLKRFPGGW